MSKAQKTEPSKAQGRPTWLIPAIIVGIVVIVLAVVAAITGNRREPFEPEVAGAPRAEFDQTRIDHGSMSFNQQAESVFRVRNVGDQPLTIQGEPRVELVQGC